MQERRKRGPAVSRNEQESPHDATPSLSADRLGPLASGSTLLVGTFADMFDHLVSEAVGSEDGSPNYEDVEALEVRIIAESMVNGEGVLGAARRFLVQRNHGQQLVVRPDETRTRQLRSRKERRRVESWLNEVWDNEGFAETWSTDHLAP